MKINAVAFLVAAVGLIGCAGEQSREGNGRAVMRADGVRVVGRQYGM